jgi:hypothetical protein
VRWKPRIFSRAVLLRASLIHPVAQRLTEPLARDDDDRAEENGRGQRRWIALACHEDETIGADGHDNCEARDGRIGSAAMTFLPDARA